MNILIKLSCLVGLAIAPILGQRAAAGASGSTLKLEQKTEQLSVKPAQPAVAPIGYGK